MSIITSQQWNDFGKSISNTSKALTPIIGLANPEATAVVYGIDMLFKFIELTTQIHEKIDDCKKNFDEAIRTQGIFHNRIDVDMTYADILYFFTDPDFTSFYNQAFHQFQIEIDDIQQTTPQSSTFNDSLNTLAVAQQVIPKIYSSPHTFHDKTLDNLFGRLLSRPPLDFRGIVLEMKLLLAKKDISINEACQLIDDYSIIELKSRNLQIEQTAQKALEKLNQDIKNLTIAALTGDSGTISATKKFIIDQSKNMITSKLASLTKKKATLNGVPDSAKTALTKVELQHIENEINDLKNLQSRIA